ncbi:MAG: hypothetical protein IJB70_10445 [Clostridia bacterium]|nr:hypothetical protein [Clostridia bacterium]
MYICTKCNQSYSTPAKFCAQCGGVVVEKSSVTQNSFNDFSASVYGTQHGVSTSPTGSVAPAIVSMILGISSVMLSFILFVAIVDMSDSYLYDFSDAIPSLMVVTALIVPAIVMGIVLASKAKAGRGMAVAGKITSFISMGINLLTWFIAMVA